MLEPLAERVWSCPASCEGPLYLGPSRSPGRSGRPLRQLVWPPQRAQGRRPGHPAALPAALPAAPGTSPAVRRGGRLEPAEVISCASPLAAWRAEPSALPLRSGRGAEGRRAPGGALNGAPQGTAGLCAASPRAPLPLQSRPAPLPATPAAGERRAGGRLGLRLERRKVGGGGGPRAPVCAVRGGDGRELAGGERPALSQLWWAGAVPRGRASGCALGPAPPAGRTILSRCLPTWKRAPSGEERWSMRPAWRPGRPCGLAPRGQEERPPGGPGVGDRPDSVAPGKGPWSGRAGCHLAIGARSLSTLPAPLPTSP